MISWRTSVVGLSKGLNKFHYYRPKFCSAMIAIAGVMTTLKSEISSISAEEQPDGV